MLVKAGKQALVSCNSYGSTQILLEFSEEGDRSQVEVEINSAQSPAESKGGHLTVRTTDAQPPVNIHGSQSGAETIDDLYPLS